MSEKLRRCIRLFQHLQTWGSIANADARSVNRCDEQTANRDIRSLIAADVPLRKRGTARNTSYEIPRSWRRTGLRLDLGDAMSLQFGRQLLAFLEGTFIPGWLDELREKLGIGMNGKIGTAERVLAEKLIYVSEPYRPYEAHDETLNEVLTAVLNEQVLDATYISRSGRRSFELWPLALVIYRRALYLLARDVEKDRVLRLPLDRFESASRQPGRTFDWPDAPDPRVMVSSSFGIFDYGDEPEEVRLRFQPEVVDLVRARHWHPTERFEDGPDGTLDLVMDTHGPELARLALEWGEHVEVIRPPALRDRVERELRTALQRYATVD